MHTCTQPWGQHCLQDHLRSLKSPGKPTEKMLPAAGLALSTSSINATSATTGVTVSLEGPFPRSPRERAGQEDVLPRESAFCGATLRPTRHSRSASASAPARSSPGRSPVPAFRLLSKTSGYQQKCQELPSCSQEDGAHPKENESQLLLRYLRPADLRTSLPRTIQVKAIVVSAMCLITGRTGTPRLC